MTELDAFESLAFESLVYDIRYEYDGACRYYNRQGQLHRENGPAVVLLFGTKIWYYNGKCHRVDGPAVECADGAKEWFINGVQLTEAEFNQRVKNE